MLWHALLNLVVGQFQVHVHFLLYLLSRLGLALVRSVLAQTQFHHSGPGDEFRDGGAKMEKGLSSSSASTSIDALVTFASLESGTQGLPIACLHVR